MEELKQKILELCWKIEALPASEQQTEISVMAGDILELVKTTHTRPLIEAFSHEELARELIRRNSVDFTQVSSGIAGLALKKLLDNDGTIEIPSLGIKTNAISPDAGMPQRGVK